MASRSQSYKTSSTMNKREKRLMRVHRRSLDQREMRHEEVNKRRQIDDMSPVVELESHEGSKNPSRSTTPANQKAALSRLERLKKWKEERELKRRLEAMERARSKPGFKVVSMKHEDHQLFQRTTVTSNSKKAEKALPLKPVVTSRQSKTKVAQPAVAPPATKSSTVNVKRTAEAFQPVKKTATATRMTRSRTAAAAANSNTRPVSVAAPKATKPKHPSPKARRSGRSNYMAPTAASKTRAAVGTKNVKKESTRAPEKKMTHQPSAEGKGADKISTHRGDLNPLAEPSFAPNDFVFEAPSSVTSFVFKPLSPASAASFLFPSAGGNSTTMSIFTKRVGRTSTPKRDGPPASTSREQKDSDEDRSASPLASSAARPYDADDGSHRRSRSRRSHALLGVVSPASTTESSASGGAKSVTASDSDMEVASREVGAGSSETATDENHCADDATHGMEVEAFKQTRSAADVNAPRQNRKRGSMRRQSTLEVEAVAEKDRQSDGENTSSPSCRQRKSKHVTRQKIGTVESQEEDTKVKSPVKRRRSSRRSTIAKSESVAQPTTGAAAIEAIAEEASSSSQPSQPGSEKAERRTPRKARRSCRSSVAEDEVAVQEDEAPMEVVPETQEGTENQDEKKRRSRASRGERRSRRSRLPNTNTVEESVPMETEAMETAAEAIDNAEQAGAPSAKKRRRSRCSVAKQQEEAAKNDEIASGTLLSLEKPAGSAEKAGLVEVVQNEVVPPEATTPKSGKRSLRGKDGPFLTPGPPVSSQRRSTAKRRRRTATMVALSTAKSPEEAIKIISTSPMVEMNRRTPKSKMSPELRLNTTAALFDDEDFLVEPVELSAVFNALSSDGTATDDVTSVDATSSSDTALTDGTTTDNATATDDALTETPSTGSADAQETAGSSGDEPAGERRDVTPFREKLSSEVEKLTRLAEQWTAVRESTPNLSEEVDSQMSTTVCQVYLLMGRKGKFHQFAGLVDKCESGDPRTTCQDLQGFWDMIFIQAEEIYSKFAQLERLKQNNWQAEVTEVAAVPKAAKKVKKAAGGGSKKEKPAVKSKFAEFRAQMKQRKAEGSSSTSQDVPEEKVFDAGFFKVNSPIRSPQYHCPAGTPVRQKSSRESQESGCTPATSLDQAATTMVTTPTTTASSTTSAKMAENKENVAQVMLRRSVGSTPGRKSYAPAVPSPLLKDAIPVPHSSSPPKSPSKRVDAAAATQQSVRESGTEKEMKKSFSRRSTPRRRSTRSRKSVCFAEEPVASTTEADREEKGLDPCYFTSSGGQPASPLKESALDNSPFSCEDILKHGASRMPAATSPSADTPLQQPATGGRQKSALKVLPTRELRRSRRSVTFSLSPSQHSSGSLALPSTPYNRNSLVAGKRVDHHSLITPGSSSHLALEELQDLQSTPQLRRSARPSLLYTPPLEMGNKPKTPVKDIPVAKLISFSP